MDQLYVRKNVPDQPEFIVWDNDRRVFRPACFLASADSLSYLIDNHVELEDEDISPEHLRLVASSYLGAVSVNESSDGDLDAVRLRGFRHQVIDRVVEAARLFAGRQNVHYFSINIFENSENFEFDYGKPSNFFEDPFSVDDQYSNPSDLVSPRGPSKLVLHPTAQLYVVERW